MGWEGIKILASHERENILAVVDGQLISVQSRLGVGTSHKRLLQLQSYIFIFISVIFKAVRSTLHYNTGYSRFC